VPGPYEDWLIAMISTQLQHAVAGFDEIVDPTEGDFQISGLKSASVIRDVGRLAVVAADVLLGAIGEINNDRLRRIGQNIAAWVQTATPVSQS
jgi:mRNA interferase MazF